MLPLTILTLCLLTPTGDVPVVCYEAAPFQVTTVYDFRSTAIAMDANAGSGVMVIGYHDNECVWHKRLTFTYSDREFVNGAAMVMEDGETVFKDGSEEPITHTNRPECIHV